MHRKSHLKLEAGSVAVFFNSSCLIRENLETPLATTGADVSGLQSFTNNKCNMWHGIVLLQKLNNVTELKSIHKKYSHIKTNVLSYLLIHTLWNDNRRVICCLFVTFPLGCRLYYVDCSLLLTINLTTIRHTPRLEIEVSWRNH